MSTLFNEIKCKFNIIPFIILISVLLTACEEKKVYTYKSITNPVAVIANDPWVYRHEGDFYYVTADDGINIRKIDNLDDLSLQGATKVWKPPKNKEYSKEIWAPELHFIEGKWYVYFAASDGPNENHRMYVIRSLTDDPLGEYEFVGKVTDDSDHWGIDGTIATINDELYMIWSGWEGDEDGEQRLYIAHMDTPTNIDSKRVCISKPDLPWERIEMPIQEGPTAIVNEKTGTHVIIYSASGSWCDDYCMGQLTLVGEDPLNPESWEKYSQPIFSKIEGAYGPGHCSIVKSYDDSLWMIYHCNIVSGSGWGGRNGWIQPIKWDGDILEMGSPITGEYSMKLAEKNTN